MSELVQTPKESKFRRFVKHLQNPVTVKELRSRMRGRRAFVVLSVYLFVMGGFISLVYLAFASSARGPFGPDARDVGRVIFSTVVGIQAFLVLFIGPSFTAGAISGEKERQTYDLLRTTLLSAPAFVTGKLLSSLSYVLLLIFTAVPIQSIAFLLGGVSFFELFLSQLILVVAAVAFSIFGLYCSTVMKSTLGASVTTFAGVLVITAGIPALVGLFAAILGPMINVLPSSGLVELLFSYLLLFLAATNLPATLVVSDIFLLEEGTYFLYTDTIGGYTAYLFSPWLLFLVVYSLLALLFYWLIVRRIRRIAEK